MTRSVRGSDLADRLRFSRTQRLSGREAFARVFAAKCSSASGCVIVYAIANDLDVTRLGLSVGRKHGGAVRRNRIKRLIREAFRLERPTMVVGLDLVVVPRAGATWTLEKARSSLVGAVKLVEKRCTK